MADELGSIGHVEVQLKRDDSDNELNKFRFDVMLHVGDEPAVAVDGPWLDWEADGVTLERLRRELDSKPERLAVSAIPNRRLAGERALARLRAEGSGRTVATLRALLDASQPD